MIFIIDKLPPSLDMIEQERSTISAEIKHISNRDTLITISLIIISSGVLSMVVYWSTDNAALAGLSAAVFPVISVVLNKMGLISLAGFRSAAMRLDELKIDLISLNPVSEDSRQDIKSLCSRYGLIDTYQKKLESVGRTPVNGELAMYWEFDASTLAKTAKGREYLDRAKESVEI